MEVTYIGIGVGLFLLGALLAWTLRTRDVSTAITKLAEAEKLLASANTKAERLSAVEAELVQSREKINELVSEKASLGATRETEAKAHQEQITQLTKLRQEVQDQFKLLAGDVLKVSSDDFTKRASELFELHKETAKKDVLDLVKPLGESLQAYEAALGEIEKARVAGYSELGTTLKALNAQNTEVRDVTANLVNALRASPKTRGRWAENTLKRVMELSGLVEHCDFETEKHFKGEDENFRPDVVIQIAENRTIIVDAKAPTSAYLDAIKSVGEEDRESNLKLHARQLRERLNDLSAKSYWQKIPGSTDCVVMFVPGDNFVSAAFEYDQDLFEDGFKSRVLICSPTTFIALAKALGYGWRQERLAANAMEVAKLGKELYTRLGKMVEYLGLVGGHLKDSVNSYNKLVGNLESRVLPSARRFNELGIEGANEEISELPAVDAVTRAIGPELEKLAFSGPKADGET